ncbi:ras-related and estrogen-regulated growth inhibitor [Lingula anatina]|uniref:small monomeric GTPase n=1 Tax=Lingula anatina TaxID=7574 RepID=A0A1S3JGG2_LINAN|nr:ras-related and estrogen-regulated growth inhibitor [Lingula anatina]|eukprot:XP_013409487.1 ras-related and estrogen-regulated growth inhibitor [Lingula anatina]
MDWLAASSGNSGEASPRSSTLKRKKSAVQDARLLVLGPSAVGKSAVVVRFLTKRFIGEYDHSSEIKYKHTVVIDQENVVFEILDSCSSEKITEDTFEEHMKWADGIVLLYAITSFKTFELVKKLSKRLQEHRRSNYMTPMILLGNKRDMSHVRQVTKIQGEHLSHELNCLFAEVSASEDATEIADAFLNLYREIQNSKRRSRTFLDKVFGSLGTKSKN